MTVTTVLASFKTLMAGLSPSSGAAVQNYAIPADMDSTKSNGGMNFSTFPVTISAQRLGNDAGVNNVQVLGTGEHIHNYAVEVMVALVEADTLNKRLATSSSVAVFAPYETTAQLWLASLASALIADPTLGGVVYRSDSADGQIIADYRIGYLPIEKPQVFGMWASIPVIEGIS